MQPWSPAVHELLDHLAAINFRYSPRLLGVDDKGREVLTYFEGVSGKHAWAGVVPEEGLRAFARLLRSYHDAVANFEPANNEWALAARAPKEGEIICHGDFGPWNVVWNGSEPIGILDWDLAGPAPPLYDLAYALEFVAPFRDDEDCIKWLAYSKPPNRPRRIEVFAEAYGLKTTHGLVDEVIAVQHARIEHVTALAGRGQQPHVQWVADGYLDELATRAEWSIGHRRLFE
jgi:Phosphotransferase enzyme family